VHRRINCETLGHEKCSAAVSLECIMAFPTSLSDKIEAVRARRVSGRFLGEVKNDGRSRCNNSTARVDK